MLYYQMKIVAFAVLGLALATNAYAGPGKLYHVRMDGTKVYEAPSATAPVIMQLNQGDRVLEWRRQGQWVKVSRMGAVGKDGWVRISRLRAEARKIQIKVSVDSRASGRFGQHPQGLGGIALDMVPGFVFDGPSTIEITAIGQIDLLPQFERGLRFSPSGKTFELDRDNLSFLPLEEAAVDSGVDPATFPDGVAYAGALIGAFVPKRTVEKPGFLPRDEDRRLAGIASDQLFFIGSGPFKFMATEPGTLFLGINDSRPGNNRGSFIVTLTVID